MSAGSLKVKIFDAKGTQLVPVAKSTVTIGSNTHCDVVLDHPTIQEEHVRAWIDGGRIWIQDLGTSGGTFVNGIRLPPLKPMLVRDLDVLKLGECPATLGLEANLVRAPVVKAKASAAPEANTLTDIKPLAAKDPDLEKRREELAKVSRELAEVKLQLQMGRLEKGSTEELRKQINSLREELRLLGEERERAARELKRLEREREELVAATEGELAEMKLKAERDIKDMRDSHGRKLGHWKVDAVAEMSRQLHVLTQQKQRAWTTRPLSQDMIFEWESDLNLLFRRILLDEAVHPPAVAEHTHTNTSTSLRGAAVEAASKNAPPSPPGPAPRVSASTSSGSRARSARSKSRPGPRWDRIGMVAGAALLLGLMAMLARPYVRRSSPRALAGTPGTAAVRFQPQQNRDFKRSYTENMLYTESFARAEMNPAFRKAWLAEFARGAKSDLKLDDSTISAVNSKEQQLLADLQRLKDGIQVQQVDQGIAQMRAREAQFQQELLKLLKSPQQVERFQRMKRAFFTKNQSNLARY